jgi:hypothetical protein
VLRADVDLEFFGLEHFYASDDRRLRTDELIYCVVGGRLSSVAR